MSEMIEMIENEVNEEKVKVLVDYAPIVKDITIRTINTKKSTFYNAKITLKMDGIAPVETRMDNDLVNYVLACQKLKKQAIVKKELLKEENTETGKEYFCLKLTLDNGKIFRYFISRADVSTIELLYSDYNTKK